MLKVATFILTISIGFVFGNGIGSKISGGSNAKRGDSGFTVRFTKSEDSSYSCGGTLVEEDWVVTAASCFDGDEPLLSYKVVVGDYRTDREDGEVVVQPDIYVLHPDYDSSTRLNNLAVVHLSASVNISEDNIELVPRLSTNALDKKIGRKDNCLITSYGPDDTGVFPNRIQSAKVSVQEDGSCSSIQGYDNDTNLCYTTDPAAPCNGDEGAPIACQIGRDMVLVGVHSNGSCTTGSHVASQISFYKRWIVKTIAESTPTSCGNVPEVDNGTYETNGTNSVDDTATLKCEENYVLNSSVPNGAVITCQSDGEWSNNGASCLRSCGEPPVIDNANYTLNGSNVESDTATIVCEQGYLISSEVEQDAIITCQTNGQWTTTNVSCLLICDSLPETSNGTFVLRGRNVVNDTAVLTCDNGYGRTSSTEEDAIITCGQNGSWGSTDVTCQRSCGSVPTIDDGVFMTNGTNVFNDTAVLKCDADYVLSSDVIAEATITCQENGTWTIAKTTCLRVCDALPTVLNGTFALNGDNVENTSAVLVCDQGFETSSVNATQLTINCEEDGMWTSTEATCIRSCGTVPVALNGSFVTDGRNIVNDIAVLQCDNGFERSTELDNDATITCQDNGNWNATTATCIRSCGNLPEVMNGTFETNGTNIVNDKAYLVCDSDYSPSSKDLLQITCQNNGSWSTIDTVCLKECDVLPDIQNGSYILSGDGVVNDTADLKCDSGFVKTSDISALITCQSDGTWSSNEISCVRSCGIPPAIDNAKYTSNGSNVENETALIECYTGYLISSEIEEDATITCQMNGQWTTTGVSCLLICDSLPKTSNGTFVLSGRNVVNDTALLTCDSGFDRTSSTEENAIITCEQDGTWGSTDVTCQRSCGSVTAIDDGVFMTNGTNVYNDTAVLKCDADYVLSSDIIAEATIICQENGIWSNAKTTCLRVCDALPTVLNGTFSLNGDNVENTSAVLVCDTGFETSSINTTLLTITCEDDGMWTSTEVTCIRSCGTVPLALNGSFVSGGRNIVNDIAVLQCDEGFQRSAKLDSDAAIVCQEDGNWNATDATCLRSCGDLPGVTNGTFETNGTNIINDKAILVCESGFTPSSLDSLQITCQSNGSWSAISTVCLKECDILPSVLNGSYILSGDGVVDDTADLECDSGFVKTSDASALITCQSDGTWSSNEISCIRSCGIPTAIDNANYTSNGSNVENDTALIKCYTGYLISSEIEEDATITCQKNGQWTTTDVSCLLICDSLPETSNGTFVLSGRNMVNDTALLTCDAGFDRTSSSEENAIITCEQDGTWGSTDVTCERSCGSVPIIDNGVFMTNGTKIFNNTAVLKCDADYVLSSDVIAEATITCQENGTWTSSKTTCLRVCDALPTVLNGTFALNGDNVENTSAVLVCDPGFETSSKNATQFTITCEGDGMWTSTEATCIRKCETLPLALNGSFVTGGRGIVNDLAVLQCDEGFERSAKLDIDATIVCQEDGNWNATDATCIRSCGNLPEVLNGTFETSGINIVNDNANLVCDSGFAPSSKDLLQITCQSNGSWSSIQTVCLKECGSLTNTTNGVYISNGRFLENDVATLVCDKGYRISSDLLSDATIACQKDGSWTSHNITCDQECGSEGTSFVFGYLQSGGSRSRPYIYLFAKERTSVTINVPFYPDRLRIQVDEFASIRLDNSVVGFGTEEESNKGVEVFSDLPITVYSYYGRTQRRNPSAGATLIIPEQCASNEYLVVAHGNSATNGINSEFMIVGLEDNTDISIELPSGLTKPINLNRYGTYQFQDIDVTGAIIKANAKINTIAGHMCAYIPTDTTRRCDYIVESMPPLSSLKRAYILSYMKPRLNFAVRIVAAYDATTVTIRNSSGILIESITLGTAQNYFTNFNDSSSISITSDKAILVAQYGHGTSSDRVGLGDPSMAVLPAVGQFENSYNIFASPQFRENHLSVVIRSSSDKTGLRLNGEELDSSEVVPVHIPGYGDFEILYIELFERYNTLDHVVNGTTFGVLQYGLRRELEVSLVPGRIF